MLAGLFAFFVGEPLLDRALMKHPMDEGYRGQKGI